MASHLAALETRLKETDGQLPSLHVGVVTPISARAARWTWRRPPVAGAPATTAPYRTLRGPSIQRGGRRVPDDARRDDSHGIALPPANACAQCGARCSSGDARPIAIWAAHAAAALSDT
jgi:hypothetical protein